MKQTPPDLRAFHSRMRHLFFVDKINTAEIGRRLNQPEHYVDRLISHSLGTRWQAAKKRAHRDPLDVIMSKSNSAFAFTNAACRSCNKSFLALDENDRTCTRCLMNAIGYGPEPIMVVAKDMPPYTVGRPRKYTIA